MFIGGMGMPIGIIMFADGMQRSSNCSKVGRFDGARLGEQCTNFDAMAEIH
jgi:hypothetical protein